VRDDSGLPQIDFHAMNPAEPPAGDLLAAMVAEMVELYDGMGPPPATTADLTPPRGIFLVGFEGDEPVCSGALTLLGDRAAEIKRMYVVPAARRRGIARRLLAALEDAARDMGCDVVRLDTGARQPHAQALYEASGYVAVPDYNANPKAAFWGEKRL
jgi:GNAT superfamily N-acetyltransferase